LASGQVDRVADQEKLDAREDLPPVGSLEVVLVPVEVEVAVPAR
jgi:hypothetical protein